MKKTYKTTPNRNCYLRIGKALVRVEFDSNGEYSTDNSLFQKAIEDSYPFKTRELQLATTALNWIPIDRDENGFATEECLNRIEEYYENYTPVVIAFDNYCQDYAVITAASKLDAWLYSIRINTSYTH